MRGMSPKHLAMFKKRRTALDTLTKKYPDGYTLKTIFEECPSLFENYRQVSTFMIVLKKKDRKLNMVKRNNEFYYYTSEEPYKMLNQLWGTQNV